MLREPEIDLDTLIEEALEKVIAHIQICQQCYDSMVASNGHMCTKGRELYLKYFNLDASVSS